MTIEHNKISGRNAVHILILGGAAYAWIGTSALASLGEYQMPARAQQALMPAAKPLPLPTDAELEAFFREARGFGGGGLDELPRDRD